MAYSKSLLIAVLVLALSSMSSTAGATDRRQVDAADQLSVDAWIDRELPGLLKTYRHLHAHPELSLHEVETARLVAESLRDAGYSVEAGLGGHGVVGILRNGDGPTLLIRGDMDALPVVEATGLPYASVVRTKNAAGLRVGTMHACGHDVHVTNLIGTARLLASIGEAWRGTLVILAQPAEELGQGASSMIDDGLFDRIPMPDHGLALHVAGELPAGTIGFVSGWAAANVDSVKITMFGRGGHGARPHQTMDPIVASAHLVMALQTIVSRRVDPSESAVVTVGTFHGGTKNNVIPDEVVLELTVRSYTDEVRQLLLSSIEDMARETCNLFGCPRPPEVWIKPDFTPAMFNDPGLVAHAVELFRSLLSDENVREVAATMTGEDFGRYSRRANFPTFLYRLGSVNPERWKEAEQGGEPLPSLHSSRYFPDAEPTLRTGLRSMSRLALSLLGPPDPKK